MKKMSVRLNEDRRLGQDREVGVGEEEVAAESFGGKRLESQNFRSRSK